MIYKIITPVLILFVLSCSNQQKHIVREEQPGSSNWQSEVLQTLKLFGHRNWIVIADAAYPQQSNPAIKTIAIDATQLEAVEFVTKSIQSSHHVTANIFTDKEMAFVSEEDAPGIDTYRMSLMKILKDKPVTTKLHESIIKELDSSAKLFNILIIKTNMVIPYTSVFFQLECGYWNAKAEERLRKLLIKP